MYTFIWDVFVDDMGAGHGLKPDVIPKAVWKWCLVQRMFGATCGSTLTGESKATRMRSTDFPELRFGD